MIYIYSSRDVDEYFEDEMQVLFDEADYLEDKLRLLEARRKSIVQNDGTMYFVCNEYDFDISKTKRNIEENAQKIEKLKRTYREKAHNRVGFIVEQRINKRGR